MFELRLYGWVFATLAFSGCGDDDDPRNLDSGVSDAGAIFDGGDASPADASSTDAGAADATVETATNWTLEDPNPVRMDGDLVIDTFFVPGATPEPNPETNASTPAELNGSYVTRYKRDTKEQPDAYVVAMPGYLAGASAFDALARGILARGAEAGRDIEFWAVDRRANGLEDMKGMQVAELEQNAEIANAYYYGEDTVNGEPFAGFVAAEDASFMSEWGLAVHMNDLRAVLERVPSEARRSSTFLLGHSFGAAISELFAAWEFEDGQRGTDMIAGLVFLDPVVTSAPLTETQYMTGIESTSPVAPRGLPEIRSTTPYSELPILGVSVYARAEVMALRSWFDPDGIVEDRGRDDVMKLLLGLSQIPDMTNEAALGFVFDEHSEFLSFICSSLGEGTGGPIEEYNSIFGTVQVHPTDPDATYSWLSAEEVEDRTEWTDIAAYSRALTAGSTNFIEWYFPTRLLLDISAAGTGTLEESAWQTQYGIRARDAASIDAPILAVPTEIADANDFENLRARVAPIGKGRPHSGVARSEEVAFRVVEVESMSHVDPVTAADSEENPVLAAVMEFIDAHLAE